MNVFVSVVVGITVGSTAPDGGTSHAHRWQPIDAMLVHGEGVVAHIDERCRCGAIRHTQWGRDAAGNVTRPRGGAR